MGKIHFPRESTLVIRFPDRDGKEIPLNIKSAELGRIEFYYRDGRRLTIEFDVGPVKYDKAGLFAASRALFADRMRGDLPLGTEIPLEIFESTVGKSWFASQLELFESCGHSIVELAEETVAAMTATHPQLSKLQRQIMVELHKKWLKEVKEGSW